MRCRISQELSDRVRPFMGLTAACLLLSAAKALTAEEALPDPPAPNFGDNSTQPSSEAAEDPETTFYIKQIRVRGSKLLSAGEIENIIYPFLGPGRSLDDLEEARGALEKAFKDKGYQTVAVEIPQQNGTRGIIFMDVVENRIGRVTVKGARYFLPSEIKRAAPSLAEGTVPDFNLVTKDIVALNAWPERQVIPSIRPGVAPNTVDIDLEVKDKSPLHGSLEVNNRYSPNTTELRLNGSISYANLWQKGHSFGIASQVAPERIEDAMVISTFYVTRFPQLSNFSLMVSATMQDSNVSTLGGAAVAGAGSIMGFRGMWNLPGRGIYFHSVSAGMDYKSFRENIIVGLDEIQTPIDYYPISVAYGGGWAGKNFFTDLNASVNFHLRGMGSDPNTFDARRYQSDGGWMYLRADTSHTQELPGGFQAFAKFQTQLSNSPLSTASKSPVAAHRQSGVIWSLPRSATTAGSRRLNFGHRHS